MNGRPHPRSSCDCRANSKTFEDRLSLLHRWQSDASQGEQQEFLFARRCGGRNSSRRRQVQTTFVQEGTHRRGTPLTGGDFSAVPMEKIDPRRLKPGAYVSLDDVGPYYGAYMASFCDFATGYGFEKPMGKLGRAAGPDCARAADAHFKSVRSPIGVLCSDSLSVYDSKAMESSRRLWFQTTLDPTESEGIQSC